MLAAPLISSPARSATKNQFRAYQLRYLPKDQNCPQRCLNSWHTPPEAGGVRAICFSDAELDGSRVTVLGCGNGCCIRLRRRTLVYLLASAVIALPSVDAFSNPAHKQAASHPSKAVKAENHKHRVGTQGSHRKRTAKAENHKHQSQTEAKHSERALGPRILLPRDPTGTADSTSATQLPPELAPIKQAIRQVQRHKFGEATALTASINDPVAQKLVEWTYLRDSESPAGFDRYNAFLQANPEWSSMVLRRHAEARLWQEGRGAATVRRFVGEQPVSALGRLAIARVMLGEGDRAGASHEVRAIWQSEELSAALESAVARAFPGALTADNDVARMDRRIGAKDFGAAMRAARRLAAQLKSRL